MAIDKKAATDSAIYRLEHLRLLGLIGGDSGNSTSASLSRSTSTTDYEVRDGQSGTGYSAGQKLRRTVVRDISVAPSTLLETLWENLDTLQVLASAPNPVHLEPLGDDTEAALAAISGNTAPGTKITAATMPPGGTGPIGWLSAIWQSVSAIGSASDAAAATDTANTGLISLIKRSLQRLSNLHAVFCTGDVAGGPAADNAAVTGTIPAPGAGLATLIKSYTFSYGADPASAGNLTITAGSQALVDVDITTGGPGPVPINHPAPANTAVAYSLPASGTTGVFGRLKIYYTTVEVLS